MTSTNTKLSKGTTTSKDETSLHATTTTKDTTKTSPTPWATDICGDQYEAFFDHFKILGKNFDSTVMGMDGSGVHKAISGTFIRCLAHELRVILMLISV